MIKDGKDVRVWVSAQLLEGFVIPPACGAASPPASFCTSTEFVIDVHLIFQMRALCTYQPIISDAQLVLRA
jgi:hypothetical protein